MFRLTGLGPARDDSIGKPADATPPKPFSAKGSQMPPTTAPAQPPSRTEIPRRSLDIPNAPRKSPESGDAKKLVVGREIRLSGAICSCDCLVVEGTVEADLSDTRTIVVARGGTFSGTATVAFAEISGLFDGELTDTCAVRDGGTIKGAIHYANLVMDHGTAVEGSLSVLARKPAAIDAPAPAAEPAG